MRVHLIAIGGSAMHNFALALQENGAVVSGSDDEIFEPSRGRLAAQGLLPEEMGWFPEKITNDIDVVILGMHARENNPELIKAQELGLKVVSYPEFLYEHSKDKKRVVIGGSHGKTTVTSMVMHVLNFHKIDFDFMVGAQLDGFSTMVKLSDAPIIILEGDEYLSSPIDRRPKFHWYKPHVAMLTGIAWDHINVFPTFENYVSQFKIFAESIVDDGHLIYFKEDEAIQEIVFSCRDMNIVPYSTPDHIIEEGKTSLLLQDGKIPVEIFGAHNLQNLEGARLLLSQIGVTDVMFYKAISSFKGAAKRLEIIRELPDFIAFKDFAHSPSKLMATINAVKEQYAGRELVACMELHTFSSLNKDFMKEYEGAMDVADKAIVFYDEHTVAHKKLPSISTDDVKEAFKRKDIVAINDRQQFQDALKSIKWKNKVLLLMSSGNFGGIKVEDFVKTLQLK